MNLPNKLTVLRIILVPIFILFLLIDNIPHHYLISLLIFLIASITDHLDGQIARKRNLITDFGKFADPLADKILVMAAFICFIELNLIGAVAVILMIIREFMVTSVRLVSASSGKVIAANFWGKAKTVSQMIAILVVLLLQYFNELISMKLIVLPSAYNSFELESIFSIIGVTLIWISAILTIISGVIYMWDNRSFIKFAK